MKRFDEMGFTPEILRAISELGFEQPMPVQEKVIPYMLEDRADIIALAQTGTGKTAAFGLPLVQTTDRETGITQALILCPTRELCIQITDDLNDYARYTGGLNILAVYGGSSIENQIRSLKKGVQIIVATPGRLMDLIRRRAANLSAVHTVVLDEADEMLNMGFLDSINEILEKVPDERRTLLFSATMSKEIASIAGSYMKDPIEVTIGTKNSSGENISHEYFLVHAKDKYKILKRLADFYPDIYGIVFCRTRQETREIAAKLINDGYNADALHGDLSQAQRDSVMQKFRAGHLSLLVATDVAARGLDVDSLTHVINFSLPDDIEVYTHRCGRTGRAGKTGRSISLVHLREKNQLHRIERMLKKNFTSLPVPSGSEICKNQLLSWVKKLQAVDTNHREIAKLIPEVEDMLRDMDREELIHRVVSLEFDRFLNDYRSGEEMIEPVHERRRNADDGDAQQKRRNDDDGNARQKRRDDENGKVQRRKYSGDYLRLFINLGKSDGFYPEQLIEMVNSNTKGKKIEIGKIDLQKNFSFFEVDSTQAVNLVAALNNTKYMKRKVTVEIAQEKKERGSSEDTRSRRKDERHSGRKEKKSRIKSTFRNTKKSR